MRGEYVQNHGCWVFLFRKVADSILRWKMLDCVGFFISLCHVHSQTISNNFCCIVVLCIVWYFVGLLLGRFFFPPMSRRKRGWPYWLNFFQVLFSKIKSKKLAGVIHVFRNHWQLGKRSRCWQWSVAANHKADTSFCCFGSRRLRYFLRSTFATTSTAFIVYPDQSKADSGKKRPYIVRAQAADGLGVKMISEARGNVSASGKVLLL